MTARSSRRLLLVALAALLAAMGLSGMSGAQFTSSSSSGASTVTAADWTPPTVALIVRKHPHLHSGVVTLSATASDTEGPVTVRLDISVAHQATWSVLCAPTAPPLSCAWDTTEWSDGQYSLRAVATDAFGNTSEHVEHEVFVDNTP